MANFDDRQGTLLPPSIANALDTLRAYGQGAPVQSPDAIDRTTPPVGLYPQGFNPYAAPADQRGGQPFDFGRFVGGVGPYVSDVVGGAFDTLGTAAHNAVETPGNIADAYRAVFSGIRGPELEAKVSKAEGSAGGALTGGLGVLATPFTAASGTIIEKQVENDPNVADIFKARIAELPEDEQQRPSVRQSIAHAVVDQEASRLIHAVDDPTLTDDQRRAAFTAASLLTLERVAEFGGPQIVQQVARFAPKAAEEIASRLPARPAPALSADTVASRIGTVTPTEARTARTFADTSPEQMAAVDAIKQEAVNREAKRIGAAPVETAPTIPQSPQLGEDLANAQRRQSRRVIDLSSRALPSETGAPAGITIEQGQELLRGLDAFGVPPEVRARVEAQIQAALDTRNALAAGGKVTTRAERQTARAEFTQAGREATSAIGAEARAANAVSRAQDELAARDAGLRGAETQAVARAAQEEARQAARVQAEAAAAARVPQSLSDRLDAMEQRLTGSFASVTSAPTQVARALRAEAKRTRQQIGTLPHRGLIGSRSLQPDFGGLHSDVRQTEAQRAYGSGLAQGRNAYRATSDRLSLETHADELDSLAKDINQAQRDIVSANRRLRTAGRPYAGLDPTERELFKNGTSYREFMGIDQKALDAEIDAADIAARDASGRLHSLLQQAKELGIRPHQVDEAQKLIEALRSDVTDMRGLMARASERRSTLPEAQLSSAIEAEIARGRAAIEDAAISTSEVRAGSAQPTGRIPAETGYSSPGHESLLAEFGVNLGKWDSPLSRDTMAEVIKSNPDKFRAALDSMTYDEILTRVADKSGTSVSALSNALPKRGDLSARLLAADFALDKSAGDLVRAGKALANNSLTQAQFDEAYARHLDLQLAASEGTSETARALSAKKIRKVENAPFELLQADRRAKDAEKALATTEREFSRAVDEASKVQGTTADALAKAASVKDAATAETLRITATRSLEQARQRVADARAKVEAARAEHQAAIERAAEASDKAHAAYLRNAIVQGMSKEQVTVLAQMDPRDVAAIHNFVRLNKPLQRGEILGTYLLNNTYGSIPSLEANFINTGLHVLYQNAIVRPLSRLTGAVAGKALGETLVVPGETRAAWTGLFSAIPDAARLFMRTVLHGEDPEMALKYGLVGIDKESSLKFGHAPRPIVRGPLGIPVEGVLRILGGSDGFWRILDTSAESRALFVRDAYARGLRDGDVTKALADWLDHPDQATLQRASAVSLRDTFNDPAEVGTVTHRFLHLLNSDVRGFAPLRILIPAARFGVAATRHAVSLSGWGLVSGSKALAEARGLQGFARTEGGRRAAREMAEGALGAMLLVTANQLWDAGLLTGAAPDDPVERDVWRKQGKQANAILIGGHWVPQAAIGPLAAPFVLTALLRDQMDVSTNAELSDRVTRGARAIGGYLMDMPAFQGTYQLLDTIYTGLKYGATAGVERFSAAQLSKFVPESSTLNSLVPVWDPYERDPSGLIERLQGRIPLASGALPERLDRFGQPLPRRLTGAESLTPLQATIPGPVDPVDAELKNAGVSVGFVADTIGGQKLGDAEQRTYQQIAGERSYNALAFTIRTPEYQNADAATRKKLIETAVNKERDAARTVVAERLMAEATDDAAVIRAGRMLQSLLNMRELASAYADLADSGRLTTAVRAALNESRRFNGGTDRTPTVEDMVRVAPLLREFVMLPPYKVGGPADWRRLQEVRKDMAAYLDAHPRPASVSEISWYARHNLEGAKLLWVYSNPDVRNPARERLLRDHPEILPYLQVTIEVPSTNIFDTNP